MPRPHAAVGFDGAAGLGFRNTSRLDFPKLLQDQALGDFFRVWMLDRVHGWLSEEGRMEGGRSPG